jgi:hypothetical protein
MNFENGQAERFEDLLSHHAIARTTSRNTNTPTTSDRSDVLRLSVSQ